MASTLVVEDTDEKFEGIAAVVRGASLSASPHIDRARSVVGAAELMKNRRYDLVVLDLLIPQRDSDPLPIKEGGARLLAAMGADSRLRRPAYIVGMTAFKTLQRVDSVKFDKQLAEVLVYDSAKSMWRERLALHVRRSEQEAESRVAHPSRFDVVWITALRPVEMEAVRQLPAGWERLTERGDPTEYERGIIGSGPDALTVVTATPGQAGPTHSAALTAKTIDRFRPRLVLMTGIAAGVGCHVGDLLVAEQAWDYASGKIFKPRGGRRQFLPSLVSLPIDEGIRGPLQSFCQEGAVIGEIAGAWRGAWKSGRMPRVVSGAFATGTVVVADESMVADLKKQNRKLVAIDMEAYAVLAAAALSCDPKPGAVVVKGSCDKANSKKNDRAQAFAAYLSATFAWRLLKSPALKSWIDRPRAP